MVTEIISKANYGKIQNSMWFQQFEQDLKNATKSSSYVETGQDQSKAFTNSQENYSGSKTIDLV